VGDYIDHTFETDGRIVLDLTGVTGVYDGTLGSLAMRCRRLARRGDSLTVIIRDHALRTPFEQAGLGTVVHEDQRRELRPLSS
jgi:anti-anti-sigma regulatory factor